MEPLQSLSERIAEKAVVLEEGKASGPAREEFTRLKCFGCLVDTYWRGDRRFAEPYLIEVKGRVSTAISVEMEPVKQALAGCVKHIEFQVHDMVMQGHAMPKVSETLRAAHVALALLEREQ